MNGKDCYCIQSIFIGKTGYGKSTTLNKICSQEFFKTDDINSCTKTLFSAEYRFHARKNYYFSLCDLPGIGESINSDKAYLGYYSEMLKKSHCVIYVMRADQRDYSKDLEILKPMLGSKLHKNKIMLAVNFIDKIEPVSRSSPYKPSEEQLENIKKKLLAIHKTFSVPKRNIVFYSAVEEYNICKIVKKIADILVIMATKKINIRMLDGYPRNSDGYVVSYKDKEGEFDYDHVKMMYSMDHCHEKTEEEREAYVEQQRIEYEKWVKEQLQAHIRTSKKKKELTFQERQWAIYEMTAQDNCGECGFKNCMQFAMKAASLNNNTELEECPNIDHDEAVDFCNNYDWL
jgi:predicted GTPase